MQSSKGKITTTIPGKVEVKWHIYEDDNQTQIDAQLTVFGVKTEEGAYHIIEDILSDQSIDLLFLEEIGRQGSNKVVFGIDVDGNENKLAKLVKEVETYETETETETETESESESD